MSIYPCFPLAQATTGIFSLSSCDEDTKKTLLWASLRGHKIAVATFLGKSSFFPCSSSISRRSQKKAFCRAKVLGRRNKRTREPFTYCS